MWNFDDFKMCLFKYYMKNNLVNFNLSAFTTFTRNCFSGSACREFVTCLPQIQFIFYRKIRD